MAVDETLLRRAFVCDGPEWNGWHEAADQTDLRLMRREQDRPRGHKRWCVCPVCKAIGLRP
jgi:hypothetical protein